MDGDKNETIQAYVEVRARNAEVSAMIDALMNRKSELIYLEKSLVAKLQEPIPAEAQPEQAPAEENEAEEVVLPPLPVVEEKPKEQPKQAPTLPKKPIAPQPQNTMKKANNPI